MTVTLTILTVTVFIFYVEFATFFPSLNEIAGMENPIFTALSISHRIFSISPKLAPIWIQTFNRSFTTVLNKFCIILSTFILLRSTSWLIGFWMSCFVGYSFVNSSNITRWFSVTVSGYGWWIWSGFVTFS